MVEQKIIELGYDLPKVHDNPYKFVTVFVEGNTAYISGTLPYDENGDLPITGLLGKDVSIEEGQQLARLCVLNALANLKNEIGSLDRVKQIVKVTGYISSTSEFTEQHLVLNGATETLISVFGEKGVHARTAMGAASMPLNTPLEVEMIIALK